MNVGTFYVDSIKTHIFYIALIKDGLAIGGDISLQSNNEWKGSQESWLISDFDEDILLGNLKRMSKQSVSKLKTKEALSTIRRQLIKKFIY